MSIKLSELFGGENSEQYNALMTSIVECSKDFFKEAKDDERVYAYLEATPKTSLVVEIVNKLHEMGYKITKK